jgi:hypothetical protein
VPADDVRRGVLGLVAQCTVFLLGLCISLGVGMLLGARTDGPGGLLVATLVAGVGLLGAAVLSQVAHDRIVYGRGDERGS